MQIRHTSAPCFTCESLMHTILAATRLKHYRVFSGIKMQLFESNHYVLPTSNCVFTNRSEWCAQFINVQRSPHRQQLQTALFPKDCRTMLEELCSFFSSTAKWTLFQRCYLCFCSPAMASLLLWTAARYIQTGNRESRHGVSAYSVERTLIGEFYFCARLSSSVIGSDCDGAFTGCS